ncbi:MAG: RluA family pseudouridine synthase [Rubrivivax sp.]|nr:RluA family pseudouridine synthase [Rubrivivax sp.]
MSWLPAAERPSPQVVWEAPGAADPGTGRPLILHADEAWIVIDKPSGLPAVPGRSAGLQDCAASRVQADHADARVVHRLDMDTSGLMLMARGAALQRSLSETFASRRVDKRYLALVAGQPAADAGEIDLPLSPDWPRRPRQQVDAQHGKPSLTRWKVLQRAPHHTRLELQPVTGRTHQLRVHLAAIGHPILGDRLYADALTLQAAPRLMLHAWRLSLAHPLDGAWREFESLPPF